MGKTGVVAGFVAAGLIGFGAGVSYERSQSAAEGAENSIAPTEASLPTSETTQVTIGGSAVAAANGGVEFVPVNGTPYPLSGVICRGAGIEIVVDQRAYFVSTNQYSILKAIDVSKPGSKASELPEELALKFARDIADTNQKSSLIPDVNNFAPGSYGVGTDCVDPTTGNVFIPL